jgi:two-component sensor histidine kinase
MQLTKSDSPEAFVSAINGRIGALARAHDAVARSGWTAADLLELVGREVEAFGIAGRVTVTGPSVLLDAEAVQAFAIVVHELATNAAKYGCLALPGGHLDIAWERTADDRLCFTWRERGGRQIGPPRRRGVGTMMIDTMVQQQIDGEIERSWLHDGLKVEITIPGTHLGSNPDRPPPAQDHFALSARRAEAELVRLGRAAMMT